MYVLYIQSAANKNKPYKYEWTIIGAISQCNHVGTNLDKMIMTMETNGRHGSFHFHFLNSCFYQIMWLSCWLCVVTDEAVVSHVSCNNQSWCNHSLTSCHFHKHRINLPIEKHGKRHSAKWSAYNSNKKVHAHIIVVACQLGMASIFSWDSLHKAQAACVTKSYLQDSQKWIFAVCISFRIHWIYQDPNVKINEDQPKTEKLDATSLYSFLLF